MKTLDSEFLRKFLKKVTAELDGNWVLIGGTVLPALGRDIRSTIDIDLVPLNESDSNQQKLKLMELAEKMGLAVEAVNSAGEYFLNKIPNFDSELKLLVESKNSKIYRPSSYLYLRLKLSRLTESDLEDCLAMLRIEKPSANKMDTLVKEIEKVEKSVSEGKSARLTSLKDALIRLK